MNGLHIDLRRLAWLGLLLAGLNCAAWAESTLTLGMFAYRPKTVLEARWQPLADYLSRALPGITVRLRVMNQDEIETALQRRELDFIFTNPTHFVALREHNALSGALATLVSLESGTPSASLGGVIIRRKDRGDLTDLNDLAGKTIAAGGPNYLGGYLAQMALLSQSGIDTRKLHLRFTGQPHDRVVAAVLAGEVDAGFVRSGVIEQMRHEGRLDPDRLEVIQRQSWPGFPYATSTRLYPEWAFVALPQVPPQISRRVASALLALEPEDPVSQAASIHGFTIPADYVLVEQTMRDLRLHPFDQLPTFTWQDIWERYKTTLIVLFLALGCIAALTLRLAANNRRLRTTRQEKAEVALQLEHQNQHLRTLVRTLPDLVWLKDPDGVYLSCNPRFEGFIGKKEADIVGQTDYDFVDREQADAFRAHDQLAMSRGSPSVNEEWVTFADGHRELLETTKTPMVDTQGQLIGVLGIGHDITEHKRLDDALAQRDQYQRALLDNFPFVIWLKDRDSRFLAVNQLFAKSFGVEDATSLVGKTDFDIAPRELALHYQADDRAVLESGENKHIEEEILDQGARKWVETYKAPVRIEGRIIGTVGFARDISEQKRTEDLQRYSAFQAGIAEMSVSVLHNIGNAITAVLDNATAVRQASADLARVATLLRQNSEAYTERTAEGGLNASQVQHLLAIQRQAALAIEELNQRELDRRSRRIQDSVQHIADIVRIQQSAALPSAPTSAFALGGALHDALSMLEDSLGQHHIQVEVEIDPTLGLLTLSRNRLLQALLNVLKNAYEAIRERQDSSADFAGAIRVRAEAVNADRFCIVVEDNGAGFTPEQQPDLFRFGYSTKSRGSGFGLHATGLFAQELGGAITLESAGVHQGARLRLELPRQAGSGEVAPPQPLPFVLSPSDATTDPAGQTMENP